MRTALIILGFVSLAVLLIFAVLMSPFLYDAFQSAREKRALQSRSDYPQIAAACVTLARSATNDMPFIYAADALVPPLLRSLSFSHISVNSNSVTMEFHGGFDHYGYRVKQSDTNSKQWTISFYTEKSARLLARISQD